MNMIMIINRIYKFRDIESPVFGASLIMMDNETAHHDNKCHGDKDHSIYPLMSSGMCWAV